ncbi:glycoside hydrolase family 2 protein [Paenibacillus sp. N4]|uniref:glycoside hydrolase family 2 protein n=1 Tax=Paenibacillus vietnamensis TaxID=2590547 RepID=UPI001CD151D5|nr:glycoside hydrolase family 2 TIM barrel-domain containing protein [Paenibacillus vietnamensis]MCA0755770.1 glycoside hydrolase family 2 protein [Paenibacillus vietnamensis]
MRKVVNLNMDWRFVKQDEGNAMSKVFWDEHWEAVHLPHTWNAIDGTSGGDYYKGACWYRKEFAIGSRERRNQIFIEFNGSNSVTDVYVNGRHFGQHRGGYSIFRFDITDAIEFGQKNTLAVKVDNSVFEDVYPQAADFTFYGGIYRDVNLVIVEPVHFDLLDYGSQGIYLVQEKVTAEQARLTVKSRIANESGEERKVRLWVDLLNAEGECVAYTAKEVLLAAGETKEVEVPAVIENPILWNGRKNPYCYEAKVFLTSFNDTIDEVSFPFGVRHFYVDPDKGFFLNGEHYPLRGVSRHQDRQDMGWAITKKEQEEDMELIKEMGTTSIRLAHYQHDPFFYDLCDREGMVVWAEIPFISMMSRTELEGINAKQQMIELIRQNFNHPSILFWGIQNEIQIGGERPEVRKVVKELNELTKKEDPTRLSTMANVYIVKDDDEYNFITDTVGYNRYFGWYNGKCEDFAPWLDGFHELNPNVCLGISEYGAEGIIQYHSNDPLVRDYTEEYHALCHEKVWEIFSKRPYLWSTYVWCMFDFGSSRRDEGGVKGRNNKGLITYDRKIKKDAFYLYKANWSDERFVHITSKRFVDRPDSEINVKVYSNCEAIALHSNGIEIATKTSDNGIFVFEAVPLKDGLNEIKAVSKQDGVTHVDVARFNRVKEPNPSYEAPDKGKGEAVSNWFSVPDLDNVIIEDIEITDDVFSTKVVLRELLANEEAKAIAEKYLDKLFKRMDGSMNEMVLSMNLESLTSFSQDPRKQKLFYRMNKELTKIKRTQALSEGSYL